MARNPEELPILIAQAGPLDGQRWTVEDSLVIGRDSACTVVVPSRQVSRYHARLTNSPEGMLLEDLGSKNGTHCNGQPVTEAVTLKDGDVLQIALAQQFVYLSSDATMPLSNSPAVEELDSAPRRLRLDKRAHRIWVNEQEIIPSLSVSQFRLLELLYERQGRVVSRKELITSVWDKEEAFDVSEQALDALVRRLRDRIAAIDPTHNYLVTVRGHGLRLENPLVEE
jgi:hypothetical protein